MRAGARSSVAEDEFFLGEILDVFHWRGVVGDADIGFGCRCADPGKFGGVEQCAWLTRERSKRGVACDQRKRGAVLGRLMINEPCGAVAAAAGKVLGHDRRVAGQMSTKMSRNQPRSEEHTSELQSP